ncbi:hypothetical protein BZG01_12510 [Labilibaculum manganireducens]|uniref:SH3b domain-containing protein n=1 Tax=Labilibaculum manganireducens TaxID=1940525 RepID=A0A2N3I6P3_9BACT|nr:hypothetical protein [Labilibaculum manganireducens]PKQ65980.1 hypothetical protein BZG01_12510 [Labilibaculum manganireducens]
MKTKLLIIMLLCSLNLSAQSDFKEFVKLFPKYEWSELSSIFKTREKTGKSIDPELANKSIFGEYSGRVRKQTIDYPYPTSAPHTRVNDTCYIQYHGGYHGIYDSHSDSKPNTLLPLARVDFNNDIVMLVLYYKYFNFEENYYNSSQEVYLFRKTDEQMLSAINFHGGGTWRVFLEKDTTITSYEWFPKPGDTDPTPDKVLRRIEYKIDLDGYFHQTKIEDPYESGILIEGRVQDSDGWTNVRETPDGKSKVLYKALSDSPIYVEKIENSNWGRVVQIQMGKSPDLIFKFSGYIHLSRVKQ